MSDDCPRCKILEAEIERLKESLSKFTSVKPITDAAVLDRYMAGDNQREIGESLGVTSSTCGQRLRRICRSVSHEEWLAIEVARYRALMARKAAGEGPVSFTRFRSGDLPKLPADVIEHIKQVHPNDLEAAE